MRKMGNSKGNLSSEEIILEGKYGLYKISDKNKVIGKGGNGIVYEVQQVKGQFTDKEEKLAVKILDCKDKKDKEREKRERRFIKEFKSVIQLQDLIDGILPIYDSSLLKDEKSDFKWYIMPLADRYKYFGKISVEKKLKDLKALGQIILQLHNKNFAHRDIKPQNILYYKGRVWLSDLGLIWNKEDKTQITEEYDHLGPADIRAPEMNYVNHTESVDYQKSDVYLFAKTLWIILTGISSGFQGEYSRSIAMVRLDKDKLGLKTAEPLHKLLCLATKYNWKDRIDMRDCLLLLDQQLDVINGNLSDEEIASLKYQESMGEVNVAFMPDKKVYEDPVTILKIMNEMVGMNIIFEESGKVYDLMQLRKVDITSENLFELDVKNRQLGYSGKITIAVSNIIIDKELKCIINTQEILEYSQKENIYTKLNKALASFDYDKKDIYISGEFVIKICS